MKDESEKLREVRAAAAELALQRYRQEATRWRLMEIPADFQPNEYLVFAAESHVAASRKSAVFYSRFPRRIAGSPVILPNAAKFRN